MLLLAFIIAACLFLLMWLHVLRRRAGANLAERRSLTRLRWHAWVHERAEESEDDWELVVMDKKE